VRMGHSNGRETKSLRFVVRAIGAMSNGNVLAGSMTRGNHGKCSWSTVLSLLRTLRRLGHLLSGRDPRVKRKPSANASPGLVVP
jgi:hypothetical protein